MFLAIPGNRTGPFLFLAVYKSPNQNDIEFLNKIGAILDHYWKKYDNAFIIVDFNMTVEGKHLQRMMQVYNLDNIVKRAYLFPV